MTRFEPRAVIQPGAGRGRTRQVVVPSALLAATVLVLGLTVAPSAGPSAGQATRPAGPPKPVLVWQLNVPHDVATRFSRDGKTFLTAGGNAAQVWDTGTGKPLTPPLEHGAPLYAAAFDGRGGRVLTVGAVYARVWDAATGKPASPRLRHGADAVIASAELSPDGERVLTVAAEPRDSRPGVVFLGVNAPMPETTEERRSVRVWDRVTGEMCLALEHRSYVNYARFSPDGKRILTVCATLNGTAQLWDAATGKLVRPPIVDVISGNPAGAFSRDGTRFAVTGWYRVTVHATDTSKEVARVDDFEHEDLPTGVALSPRGDVLFVASQLSGLRVWDVAAEKWVAGEWKDEPDFVHELAFDAGGREAVPLGYGSDGAGLWDVARGRRVWPADRDMGAITDARFMPDGSVLFACSAGGAAAIYRLGR